MSMFEPPFRGITAGDRVRFLMYAGRNPEGPVYVEKTATVNPLLIFPTHVVVNHGTFGKCVNEKNYISHRSPQDKRGRGTTKGA